MYNFLHSAASSRSLMSSALASASASVSTANKICRNCGRVITWRKKWESCWADIVYCSATCRKPLGALDRAFEMRLLVMLSDRRFDAVNGLKKGGATLAEVNVEEAEASVLATWAQGGDVCAKDEESDEDSSSAGEDIAKSLSTKLSSLAVDSTPSTPSHSSTVSTTESVTPSVSTTPSGDNPDTSIGSIDDPSLRSRPNNTRERCRRAARRLVDLKIVEIWQHGKVLDPSFAKGRIYLRGLPGLETDLVIARKRIEAEALKRHSVEEGKSKGKKGKSSKEKERERLEEEEREAGGNVGRGKKEKNSKYETKEFVEEVVIPQSNKKGKKGK